MSIETQIQNKVKELLDKIIESIPTNWNSLFVHLEMAEGGGTVYFFFKEEGESDYHYSVQIPDEFNYSKKTFTQQYREQFGLCKELWNIFSKNELEVWSNATISLLGGKMSLTFDYTPWTESKFGPSDTLYYFMYQNLAYFPKNESEQKLFDEMEEFQKKYNN